VIYDPHVGSTAWGLYWLLAGFVLIACGFLNIFAPSLMTRWQVQSTARQGGSRHAVGSAFQRLLGIDSTTDPWDDGGVKSKVRLLGLVMSLIGLGALIAGLLLLS
jgi:hypothetical protein